MSNDVLDESKLKVFWGDPLLQGLHVGFFLALSALVVYWIVLNRTTLGYEVRAVGYNPEAARYGGISVARNYFLAMAISGTFAGLAGAIDIVGWQFRINTNDVLLATTGFTGIAVALLGRNTAVGVGLSALLFAGAHRRHVDAQPRSRDLPSRPGVEPDPPDPGSRRAVRRRRRADSLGVRPAQAAPPESRGGDRMIERLRERLPRGGRAVAWLGILVGIAAFWVALPPLSIRNPVVPVLIGVVAVAHRDRRSQPRRAAARLGSGRGRRPRDRARLPRDEVECRPPRPGRRLVGADGRHAPVRDAARVRRDGRPLLASGAAS